VLVIEELAWNRLDEPTLDWLHGQRGALAAAGRGPEPGTRDELRAEWEAEHLGLHGDEAILSGLAARFDELAFVRRPFLHRLLGGVATEVLEQALIDGGAIQALAFRWAGRPRRVDG
jgi:hypothetical protein